ncbi:hypothetical protein DL96DRAFT_892952 [Flagelloscypha sp. PMI_526]|nr:hypothetical protein DL96DRAFT_892952 [Flagelloscypha sp. PMI_526]
MMDPALSRILDLPFSLIEECFETVSSDETVDAFLPKLDVLIDAKCTRTLLESLKAGVHSVSDDLAAVKFSTYTSTAQRLNIRRFFWTFILAISLGYKNKKRVFRCLVVILKKVHGTTSLLRRPMPEVNDITKVDELNTTVIRLLSRAIPRRFLVIFRRSMHPNKILHDSHVQAHLDKLCRCVRNVQGIEPLFATSDVQPG